MGGTPGEVLGMDKKQAAPGFRRAARGERGDHGTESGAHAAGADLGLAGEEGRVSRRGRRKRRVGRPEVCPERRSWCRAFR